MLDDFVADACKYFSLTCTFIILKKRDDVNLFSRTLPGVDPIGENLSITISQYPTILL